VLHSYIVRKSAISPNSTTMCREVKLRASFRSAVVKNTEITRNVQEKKKKRLTRERERKGRGGEETGHKVSDG